MSYVLMWKKSNIHPMNSYLPGYILNAIMLKCIRVQLAKNKISSCSKLKKWLSVKHTYSKKTWLFILPLIMPNLSKISRFLIANDFHNSLNQVMTRDSMFYFNAIMKLKFGRHWHQVQNGQWVPPGYLKLRKILVVEFQVRGYKIRKIFG